MNLKEQQYVCTLARCQSLSRAAEELFISPSALSVYISNLEKYLGVRPFERTGKGQGICPDFHRGRVRGAGGENAGAEG